MSNPLSPARDHVERFNRTYGIGNHVVSPSTGKLPPIPSDDRSELYYLVMERCAELGIETSILARLRQAEDDALDFLDEHGHPQRTYDEMIADHDAELDRWED